MDRSFQTNFAQQEGTFFSPSLTNETNSLSPLNDPKTKNVLGLSLALGAVITIALSLVVFFAIKLERQMRTFRDVNEALKALEENKPKEELSVRSSINSEGSALNSENTQVMSYGSINNSS